MQNSNVLGQAINNIFTQHDTFLSDEKLKLKKKNKAPKFQLELALSVILVDLASCDQDFHSQEFQAVSRGLRRVFGTQKTEVLELVHRAQAVIANLRGTANFAKLLSDNTSPEEKQAISGVIEELIAADGVEDGFESYLRKKYYGILGIPLPPEKPAPAGG